MTEFITLGEPLVVLASENQDISLDAAEHFSKYLAGAELGAKCCDWFESSRT